ncbi:unnamed protein product [Cuscuta epithymum]|uniref:Ubiquitin-like protease family profile domain-containing protein n=1 Tax=Cuscuta epithymum TaxID=186058 RepID=A0AAV0CU76_9ASTE|nr:unnamed protein product [Cuscuta epithymum]
MRINCYCNLSEVVKRILMKLNPNEVEEFRKTVFGWVLDVDEMKKISGQLQLGFLCNYVKKVNHIKETEAIRFHIQNSVISFTKKDLCMALGLKMDAVKPNLEEEMKGPFWEKYFGKASVKRREVQNALMEYNSEEAGVERNDGVKLALLHVLSHGLFGNQVARELPSSYVNLVEDLEAFNTYPWGEDVWADLVSNMRTNAKSLKKCKGERVTVPGCLIAIQVWAFETFTGLAKADICKVIEGREMSIPRAVKWEFLKKPHLEVFCNIIFKNKEFEWERMQATSLEIEKFPNLRPNTGGIVGERIESVKLFEKKEKKGKQKNTRIGRKRKNKEDVQEEDDDDKGTVGFGYERKVNVVLRQVRKLSKENAKLMAEMKQFKKSQKRLERFLKQILERLDNQEKGKQITEESTDESTEKEREESNEKSESEDDKNAESTEKEREESNEKSESEDDKNAESTEKEQEESNEKSESEDDKNATASEDNAEGEVESSLPNFNIFGPETQEKLKKADEGESVEEKEEGDATEANKTVDKNAIDAVTEGGVMEEEVEKNDKDAAEEGARIEEKEQEASEKGKNNVNDNDAWGDVNTQFVNEMITSVEEVEKQMLGSNSRKESTNANINVKAQDSGKGNEENEMRESMSKGEETEKDVKTICAQVKRPKRTARTPDRYTPAESRIQAKRRRKEIAKKRDEETFFPPREYGPFAEDPTEQPPVEEMNKVAEYLKVGLLKRLTKKDGDRKYRMDEDKMHGVPFLLDMHKIESKTWLYKLFVNPEWLDDTHMDVGMFYLNMKQVHYKLKGPKYTTCGPFFMQVLRRENEAVKKGEESFKTAADNSIIADDILGIAYPFDRSWAQSDFVYIPLNTGNHWVLLVLEVKERKIRIYNSNSRRADSLREIRPYVHSIEWFLPKIMDMHGVYQDIGHEPMNEKKIELEAVEDCPQQDDGGNCGMYVLKFAEFLMMGMDIKEVASLDMSMYRQKMATELFLYNAKRTKECKLKES